jgi:hypothetical protein
MMAHVDDFSWLGRLSRLALDLEAHEHPRFGRRRRVLLGCQLSEEERNKLSLKATLTEAAGLAATWEAMSAADFDIVVLRGEGSSVEYGFVKCVKGMNPAVDPRLGWVVPLAAQLDDIRLRFARIPFVLVPSRPDQPYAVIMVPPHAAYMEDPAKIPLTSTVLYLEASADECLSRRGPELPV